jgi:hypothetical protein
MTSARQSRRTFAPAKAFAITSGPIPAGSPIVMPNRGRVSLVGFIDLYRVFDLSTCCLFIVALLPIETKPTKGNQLNLKA